MSDKLYQFIEKNKWSFNDLAKLTVDEFDTLIEEIPSDIDSVTSNYDSDEAPEDEVISPTILDVLSEEQLPSPSIITQNENIFQEQSDYDQQMTEEYVQEIAEQEKGDDKNNNVPAFSGSNISEDDIPLIHFVPDVDETIIWRKIFTATKVQNFTENNGPISECETPLEMFFQLFPADLLDQLVFQTNLYATQGNKTFAPTTNEEMKIFLGINLMMGVKKLPSYKDYWSSLSEIRDEYISSAMSRTRFSWLLGNLHINNNLLQPTKGEPGYNKLYKLQPFLDMLTHTFKKSWAPGEYQSIDESMIKFKGRSTLKQYMPKKPIKRGYKLWVRADSVSGYVHQFQVYTGKIGDITEKLLGTRVVKDLTRDLVGNNHKIYFDNYFNSIGLLNDLQKDKIYACGTIRRDRKNIPVLQPDKNMNKGDIDHMMLKNGVTCMKWMDNRAVMMASNFHDPKNVEKVTRKIKVQNNIELKQYTCPHVIKDYNRHMGGVDKADMLKSIYEIDRKSKKWWHRIFFYFLDLCIVNAYIIFKTMSEGACIPLKQFRISVASGLIGVKPKTVKRGRQGSTKSPNHYKITILPEKRYDKAAHLPVFDTKRRCHHCSTKKDTRRTNIICGSCKVPLCLQTNRNCFKDFHET